MTTCGRCGGPAKRDYPGGDPENGPRETVCLDQACEDRHSYERWIDACVSEHGIFVYPDVEFGPAATMMVEPPLAIELAEFEHDDRCSGFLWLDIASVDFDHRVFAAIGWEAV